MFTLTFTPSSSNVSTESGKPGRKVRRQVPSSK